MISVQNIEKQYGVQRLFDSVSFSVHQGERIGFVGRNGHGKSTLFRIILGEETPDAGEVMIPKEYRVGHLSQELTFIEDTVLAEAASGLPELEKDATWKAERILMGLGFKVEDFNRPLTEFSGGYQMRVVLAKTLVSDPSLLLLDEPTNFLDIVSIRWLEDFLASWPGELLVITHDRRFMDRVVTHVMGIHRGKLRKYKGKTSHYYAQLAQDEEVYEKQRVNEEKRAKQMKEFITKFRAKARQANLAQSRQKTLDKMGTKDKLQEIETLQFSFPMADIPAKTILRVNNLGFGYAADAPWLIKGLDFQLEPGEHVCIIGKNGKGKTTLMKILINQLKPLAGTVKSNPNCKFGYYEQGNTAFLNPTHTIEEELMYSDAQPDMGRVRNVCGGMMFSGDLAKKKIKVLSGGEKCRVLLGKLLVAKHNVLLLDEPTHHLDMESCDAIIDAVCRFEGASIVVTHDERFLHRVATKLIIFRNDRVEFFPGTYKEFLDRIGWDDTAVSKGRPQAMRTNTKQDKRERAAFIKLRSDTLKPLEKKIDATEQAIIDNEEKVQGLNERIAALSASGDSVALVESSKELHALQQEINMLYDTLEKTSETLRVKKKEFEDRD